MAVTHTRVDQRPVKGWRSDPHVNSVQLTHAVLPGRHIALCGVPVAVLGEWWPEPSASTPISRCSVCTAAISHMWTSGRLH